LKVLHIGDKDTYALVSDVGGTVLEWVCEGEKLIFPEHKVGEKSRGGSPICFPFFGPSPFEGIPQHGWLRHQTLTVFGETENSVVLIGKNDRLPSFKWLLDYRIIIGIGPTGRLIMRLKAERLEDGEYLDLPVNPGFHPYFISDPAKFAIAQCLARVGENVVSNFPKKSVRINVADPLLVKSGKRTVLIKLGGDYTVESCLTLWSDDPEKYFCLEPVLKYPATLMDPDRGRFLKPGEKLEMICSFEVVG